MRTSQVATLLGLLVLGGACGTDTDDRPRTTTYVTQTVLGPSCGKAECHSTFAAQVGYVLDTTHGVATTLLYELANEGTNSVLFSDQPLIEAQPLASILNQKTEMNGRAPMPYDSPMPEADAQLILDWMVRGAPGSCTANVVPFCEHSDDVLVTCGAENEFVFTKDRAACPL